MKEIITALVSEVFAILVDGFLLKLAWNWTLAEIFGWKKITFFQGVWLIIATGCLLLPVMLTIKGLKD